MLGTRRPRRVGSTELTTETQRHGENQAFGTRISSLCLRVSVVNQPGPSPALLHHSSLARFGAAYLREGRFAMPRVKVRGVAPFV